MRNLFLVLLLSCTLSAATRSSQWEAVDKALEKGRPQTAIEQLDSIIAAALKAQATPEAIKAICQKIALEGTIEGGKAEEKILRLQEEIAKRPASMHPVMETVLAHWYWQYFQQNRWRFMDRSQTEVTPGDDFTTWDLSRLLAEIDRHFTMALENKDALLQIPVADYDDLLEKGTVPDRYRPTLYDFLAHEALSFYTTAEQAGALPMDTFTPSADSPLLDAQESFISWAPETTHQSSPTLKAILLYQDLLTIHREAGDVGPALDVDLNRLQFAYQVATGSTKGERYQAALTQLAAQAQRVEDPIESRILYLLAEYHHRQEDYVTAHGYATRGHQAHPDSLGANQCYNLIQRIEAKEISLTVERVRSRSLSDIQVDYRNVTEVHFRIVPYDIQTYLRNLHLHQYLHEVDVEHIIKINPVKTWSDTLPPTHDYHSRQISLSSPSGLASGLYYLIASERSDFKTQDNHIDVTPFWVSDLALVVRQPHRSGCNSVVTGLVLNAEMGTPILGAKISRYSMDRDKNNEWFYLDTVTTDLDGQFSLSPMDDRQSYVLLVEHQDQVLVSQDSYSDWPSRKLDDPYCRTVFFTDRSLYRPGQTIHYKGISLRTHPSQNEYQTLPDQTLTVALYDQNGQEVTRQQHTTNDYGSFSGSFTAPRDRVLGRMMIRLLEDRQSQTQFRVEEYKRPKFQVTLSEPVVSPKLNTQVEIPGRAVAYTGAAMGAAQVTWRVERQAIIPRWCWWVDQSRYPQTIAQGTTTSAADGTFTIPFTAQPDMSIPEENEPVFRYQVTADVTDTTGETRSEQFTLRVGYSALLADLSLDQWQTSEKPVTFSLQTQSLQSQPQSVSGTLTVYQLQQPAQVQRKDLDDSHYWRNQKRSTDKADPKTWDLADVVSTESFETDNQGRGQLEVLLPTGVYRAMVKTQDRFGQPVTGHQTFTVLDPKASAFPIPIADYLTAQQWSVEPGDNFKALWGTGYDTGQAFVEILCQNKVLRSWWTRPYRTQVPIEYPVTEDLRGGFTLRVTYIRENRAYIHEQPVDVPWTNKQLTIKWERFRSKLTPGQQETWTAVIAGPNAVEVSAEMVAGLYDLSLDQYYPHQWKTLEHLFRQECYDGHSSFENHRLDLHTIWNDWRFDQRPVEISYRHFPREFTRLGMDYIYSAGFGGSNMAFMAAPAGRAGNLSPKLMQEMKQPQYARFNAVSDEIHDDLAASSSSLDLSQVSARKNLQETAFFFPHLTAVDGVVRMEFTMPEALTEWKFQGFAHDNELRHGLLTDTVVTAKDLMVQPNPPRFVREGDVIEFTVKVSNQSAARQSGQVRLSLTDARTGESRDDWLGDTVQDQSFDIASMKSQSYSWRITVPDGGDFLVYKAVAATARLSDGEEGYLPVLSRRILVTESLPLPIRGKQTKIFSLDKLKASGQSDTLQHESLTVEMASQPAWYAVMALPYLMEYPHQCSEQIFHRLYANSLGQTIAQGDAKIRRVFDQWKATDALDSPLEKNQDLKSVMMEETPWKRQARNESQARRNVGLLFDENRLYDEMTRAQQQLAEMQLDDGLWPWFSGGRGNHYITLTIVTGFGRLRHLGLSELDMDLAVGALDALDRWMNQRYRDILKQGDLKANHLNATVCLYLYGRSFFLQDQEIDDSYQDAYKFWVNQARDYWLSQSRLSQGHIALALHRIGAKKTPKDITISIKEHAVSNEELGMFWRDTEASWWWYRSPIATQALMIEAFDEVMGDAEAVENCQVWLLKQKQTQSWKTTTATADAVYALLLRGKNLLASDALVDITLGQTQIEPEQVEAGTGYYQQRFGRGEIEPAMGDVTVTKVDEGVSWGAVHWQYLEDLSKITPYEGTPLILKKSLYTKVNTDTGPTLKAVTDSVAVGDELVTRIELRVDRDMEFVHLKDQRGSGTEPVNVLSRYRYQDGLAYYESTRDMASHFFIDYLPKGTYVFEYSARVQHKGQYQSGLASIECMYAPEFNSHSESFDLRCQ